MYTPHRLPPIQSSEDNRQLKHHHHSFRYYARRVEESLTSQVTNLICATVVTILLILGLVVFILFLSLRPHRPRFHIRDFSIPSLAQPNGLENAQIILNVTARNSNQHAGFYFDSMAGNVFYRDQQIGSTQLADPFYQEPKNTTVLYAVLSGATLTVSSQRWMEFLSDRSQGAVAFRLDIASVIRFKVVTWTSKGHRMHASCDVSVGQDGVILDKFRNLKCPVYFI